VILFARNGSIDCQNEGFVTVWHPEICLISKKLGDGLTMLERAVLTVAGGVDSFGPFETSGF
jgi:hypothetical protein